MSRWITAVGTHLLLSAAAAFGAPDGLPASYCSISCDSPAAFSRGASSGQLYISWDRGPGDRRYVIDNFAGFAGSIHSIKWWGNSTILWDGPDCDFEQPAPFVIKFYHSSGDGPDYQNPSAVYDPVYATYADTGYTWIGMPQLGQIDCYTVLLPTGYTPGDGVHWISIASKTADCDFVWAPGTADGPAPSQWLCDNGICGPDPSQGHRSFCLYTADSAGACCNEVTGACTEGPSEPDCLTLGGTFYENQSCDELPVPSTCGPCGPTADANCDGAVNTFDIDAFVVALTNPGLWRALQPCDLLCAADCNRDGSVNTFDIDAFVLCLTGDCPSQPE